MSNQNDLIAASSECPLCGVDKPHAHTKFELIERYRKEALQAEFEKGLLHWFLHYKDLLPGSFGMGIHLDEKSSDVARTYRWWPVEMIWKSFERGARFASPFPSERDEALQLHEALKIKADPFSREDIADLRARLAAKEAELKTSQDEAWENWNSVKRLQSELAAKEAELVRSDRWKLRLKEALEAEVKINEQLVADHALFVSAVLELVEELKSGFYTERTLAPLARVKEYLKDK